LDLEQNKNYKLNLPLSFKDFQMNPVTSIFFLAIIAVFVGRMKKWYFVMKSQGNSKKSEFDSLKNQNQNKQLKNEKLSQRPFQ
jgi:hypothetical protein